MSAEIHFVSDVHLPTEDCERKSLFSDYLRGLSGDRVQALYLLGDIFHSYYHLGDPLRNAYLPVLEAFRDCAERGVEIHFCRGNRDFLLGQGRDSKFISFMHIYPGSVRFTTPKRSFYCSHGDEFYSKKGYPLLKALLRNRTSRWLARTLPESVVAGIAKSITLDVRPIDSRDIYHVPNDLYEACNADSIIHGHFHRDEWIERGKIRIDLLPEWVTNPQVLIYHIHEDSFERKKPVERSG